MISHGIVCYFVKRAHYGHKPIKTEISNSKPTNEIDIEQLQMSLKRNFLIRQTKSKDEENKKKLKQLNMSKAKLGDV